MSLTFPEDRMWASEWAIIVRATRHGLTYRGFGMISPLSGIVWIRGVRRTRRSTGIYATPTLVSICEKQARYEQENFLGHRAPRA